MKGQQDGGADEAAAHIAVSQARELRGKRASICGAVFQCQPPHLGKLGRTACFRGDLRKSKNDSYT